jgi:hypothetical protein
MLCRAVLQSVIDALYTKVEADEHKRAQQKQHKPAAAAAPAGAAAGPALAAA